MHQKNSTTLSIVIPVYNEVNFLDELFNQLIFFFNMTAADTTGPAKQPRPTSSTPAIIFLFFNFNF